MLIQTAQNMHPNLCNIRYTVPILEFDLQNDCDVTALHLAEHAAFGQYNLADQIDKIAYNYGGFRVEAHIDKNSMDFSLSFYGEFAKEAIKFFQDFIANTEKPIDERSLKRYKKELREELAELDETYGQYSILRREIFTNHPFDLVSGGLKKEISNITLTQVNKYKSLIKDHGNYFLSYSRNFDPSFIPSLLNPIRASKSLNILPTVKSEKASVPGAIAFILPPISGRRISELFGALDFISNNQDLFKTLSFSLSSQPGLSLFLLFYRQKNAVTKFQKALEDDLLINLAAKYALNVGLERQILPDLCTEDLALDWQNKFDREDLPINKLLQDISVMISSIKLK